MITLLMGMICLVGTNLLFIIQYCEVILGFSK